MKVFHNNGNINFVDKNNVWVAYEGGEWEIFNRPKTNHWVGYEFDVMYFNDFFDGMVSFRLINQNTQKKCFLRLLSKNNKYSFNSLEGTIKVGKV